MNKLTKFIFVILISFILNLIWEFLHYSLYIDNSGISGSIHWIIASVGDAVFILIILLIVSFANGDFKWINKVKKIDYVLVIVLGFLTAILIEIRALYVERWDYTSAMPTLWGIGISPLLELAVTGVVSLWVAEKFVKK